MNCSEVKVMSDMSISYIEIYNQAAQDLDEDLAAAAADQSEQGDDSTPQLYNLNQILDSLGD